MEIKKVSIIPQFDLHSTDSGLVPVNIVLWNSRVCRRRWRNSVCLRHGYAFPGTGVREQPENIRLTRIVADVT